MYFICNYKIEMIVLPDLLTKSQESLLEKLIR